MAAAAAAAAGGTPAMPLLQSASRRTERTDGCAADSESVANLAAARCAERPTAVRFSLSTPHCAIVCAS